YARISSAGRRLPTFSVNLDPPLRGDAALGVALARASAERYGRDVALVEADRRSAQARVLEARTRYQPQATSSQPTQPSSRNQHRPRKKRRPQEISTDA